VAKLVGKDSSTIKNMVRLLKLPEAIQQDIREARITAGHGKALLSLEDKPELMMQARNDVLSKGLTVRETENLTKKLNRHSKKKPNREREERIAYFESLGRSISDSLNGIKVSIASSSKDTKIIMHCNDKESIEFLLKKLNISVMS
jgi:ParB family chromosome partitioning protein